MQHARAHGNLDQRLTATGQSFMIAAEATPTEDPGEGSLNDPVTLPTKAVFGFWLVAIVLSFRDVLV